jgi:hypothetical protein
MTNCPTGPRRKKYFQLSSQIAQLDNAQLRSLFERSDAHESSTGWGTNHTIDFGQTKVFVKRVPVTSMEYANQFSTSNLYNLPTACSYGFGSPGFNVFRELITHIKTTNWVLAGEIAAFPLLYHYRIMPFFQRLRAVEGAHWGNNANVKKYGLDKAIANHELVLFLEHVPWVLETWLHENPSKLRKVLTDIRTAIDFLRAKGIIHFDAHFRNILTDESKHT